MGGPARTPHAPREVMVRGKLDYYQAEREEYGQIVASLVEQRSSARCAWAEDQEDSADHSRVPRFPAETAVRLGPGHHGGKPCEPLPRTIPEGMIFLTSARPGTVAGSNVLSIRPVPDRGTPSRPARQIYPLRLSEMGTGSPHVLRGFVRPQPQRRARRTDRTTHAGVSAFSAYSAFPACAKGCYRFGTSLTTKPSPFPA